MRLIEATADATEAPLLALLVPGLRPKGRAHGIGVLLTDGAILTGLLFAQQPLVVQVPAVQGLVLRREALVAGCGPDRLDLVEFGQLGRCQRRRFGGEDLCGKHKK